MAKVKITGHASGSGVITVTAPNTSTDRTITLPDSTGTLATTADTFNPDGAVTINDSGADVDFRVESDTVTHALFVDGATGAVGLGTTAGNYNSTADNLVVYDADQHAGITIASGGANKVGAIYFADGTSGTAEYEGYIEYNHNTNGMIFGTNHASRLDLTSDGRGLSKFTAKAWAIYSTAGTPGYWGSNYHNTSSFVDHAVGDQTINFANAMGSTQFAVVASGGASTTNPSDKNVATVPVNSTSCRIEIYNMSGTHYDLDYVSIIVFAF